MKLLVVNSAVTAEVNELKNICNAIFRLTFYRPVETRGAGGAAAPPDFR